MVILAPLQAFFPLWIWTETITRLDVKTEMVFECLKGLLCHLWVGTGIIEEHSILK
jgi:hypothetical protein